MKNIQKSLLGLAIALTSTLPALADYSQFDVKGTLDNSITVQVFDPNDTLFSGNDNTTTIPSIEFGKINTSGQSPALADIGAGIGGKAVNTFASYVADNTSGTLQVPGYFIPVGAPVQQVAGLFAITAPGGAIRVQVDSLASSGTNLNVSYTTQSGTPPDLVLADSSVSLAPSGQAFPPASGAAIIPVGSSNIALAGTNGVISNIPMINGPTGRLNMNIGLMAFNAAGGGTLTDGAFTGRVKFTATP